MIVMINWFLMLCGHIPDEIFNDGEPIVSVGPSGIGGLYNAEV